jgi:CDP-4-dehydro-6-deoxyglucose reductase/3-phenylpropionate/trans-cinnamate dioxygenase ferredoxin reductase subunit/phenol hydroxylase P5 protein
VGATVRIGDREAACAEGQPILDALLRAGVWMPNSCNQGTCGTCKLQVVEGEVDHGTSPLDTLTPDERVSGLALGCQARPCTDTVVALPGGAATRSTHELRDFDATVAGIEDVARDTRRILLRLEEPLRFEAGQYVELVVPGTDQRRQYSLANVAEEDKELELHVRLVPGGLATHGWLCRDLAVGDVVRASGPLGDFHLPPAEEDAGEPMVLIGGGTGLAPLLGIARTALARHPDRQVVLYHGVRDEQDLYAGELLDDLSSTYPGFGYHQVLSEAPDETSLRTGFPTDAFLDDVPSARGWSGWLCGPPPMVEAGVKAFKRRRMAPRLIHREKFTPAEPATTPFIQES